jgi:hypothetical protein
MKKVTAPFSLRAADILDAVWHLWAPIRSAGVVAFKGLRASLLIHNA